MAISEEKFQFEELFRKAGLPMIINNYKPSLRTFKKSAPLFGVVSMLELLILSVQGVSLPLTLLASLVAGVGFAFLPRIQNFGTVESQLAVFVALPVAIAWIFADWSAALIVAGINISLLATIAAGIGYGLFAILIWTLSNLLHQLRACVSLLSRAVPLLLIFSLLIFVTVEIWQTIGVISVGKFVLVVFLFIGLGIMFLVVHVPEELEAVKEGISQEYPMKKLERLNLILVIVVGQMVQALVVGAAVGVFFTLLGAIMIDPETAASWSQSGSEVILDIPLVGVLTEQLLSVTVFMAAFTTFYFTVAIMTDDVYRREFGRGVNEDLQATFVQRDLYLTLINQEEALSDSQKKV